MKVLQKIYGEGRGISVGDIVAYSYGSHPKTYVGKVVGLAPNTGKCRIARQGNLPLSVNRKDVVVIPNLEAHAEENFPEFFL